MLKEFKEFATRGNIMDMAVGVIIGGSFQKIVTSLVEDIIMPTISIFTGKVDFSNMVFQFGNSSIKYGNFITAIVNFFIIAFSIFLMVHYTNKLNRKLEKMKLDEINKINSKLNNSNMKKKFLIKNLNNDNLQNPLSEEEKDVSEDNLKDSKNKNIKNENIQKNPKKEISLTTKICPYCFTEINVKATRCPHCTSRIPDSKQKRA